MASDGKIHAAVSDSIKKKKKAKCKYNSISLPVWGRVLVKYICLQKVSMGQRQICAMFLKLQLGGEGEEYYPVMIACKFFRFFIIFATWGEKCVVSVL